MIYCNNIKHVLKDHNILFNTLYPIYLQYTLQTSFLIFDYKVLIFYLVLIYNILGIQIQNFKMNLFELVLNYT